MKTATLTQQKNYHSSITVNTSAEDAFKKINDVPSWWATDFEGTAKKLNDVFTIHFGETSVTFKISELVPDTKIIWKVIDCHLPWLKDKKEWNNTEILWEINSKNNSTKIDMTHVGLVPEIECYEQCEQGWNHFVKESLFKLLEENEGMPVVGGWRKEN